MTPSDLHRKLTFLTGTTATSGDNTLIAAPGVGLTIVIAGFQLQNESATATTLKLRFGAADVYRALCQAQGDGALCIFPPGRNWRVGDNTALVLNLSGANSCGYSLWYYVEATSVAG